MNKIEEAITDYWGERCPEHEPECPTCQAWGELDKLSDECTEAHRLLKTCRAVLNMAGYYDLVQAIDNLIDGYHITEELRRPEQVAADIDQDLPF